MILNPVYPRLSSGDIINHNKALRIKFGILELPVKIRDVYVLCVSITRLAYGGH